MIVKKDQPQETAVRAIPLSCWCLMRKGQLDIRVYEGREKRGEIGSDGELFHGRKRDYVYAQNTRSGMMIIKNDFSCLILSGPCMIKPAQRNLL